MKVNDKVNDMYSVHTHYKGGAAFGSGTSFVVSFVVAMNRVDIVALNTIFALRLSKTGRTVGRTDSRLDGWSVGRTKTRFIISKTVLSKNTCCVLLRYVALVYIMLRYFGRSC